MRLKDKVAIVTGASSEIGASILKRLVEEGAKVVLLGRNLNSLEKARSEVTDKDATVAISCDVTNESQVIQTMSQILNNFGKVDILVNSAGTINDPIHFHEMSESEITSVNFRPLLILLGMIKFQYNQCLQTPPSTALL